MPKLIYKIVLILLSISIFSSLFGQSQNQDLIDKEWSARWISHPKLKGNEYAVVKFGKDFDLTSKPEKYIIHVSADNRYKLFINGNYIGNGPARGDLTNWRYETYDIATYLQVGQNKIRAIVWNFGKDRPVFQTTTHTEFIVQGNSNAEESINTDSSYLVSIDAAYQPFNTNLQTYFVVGPGEIFDASKHDFNWLSTPLKKQIHTRAKEGSKGMPTAAISAYGQGPEKVLIPRTIPMMEEKNQVFASIRKSKPSLGGSYLQNTKVTIPPHTTYTAIIDQGHLTNAYPFINFSRGKGATIKLTYAESLYDEMGDKGNRNEIEGKSIKGERDSVICDGGINREFKTLWWRTFRYVELVIKTKGNSLDINNLQSTFTGYPLQQMANFKSSDVLSDSIWNVGWRTQRLCAGENFFDCPYYEQLQYVGDTRIQALIARYVSGDTALMRNAIVSYSDSYKPLGLTESRYPSAEKQIIPPFSLIWIYMLNDYRLLCQDDKLIHANLPKIMGILDWYEQHIDASGLLGQMEWWNFVDWINTWKNGIPPGGHDGGSAIITLQYVLALQKAADIFESQDLTQLANNYRVRANELNKIIINTCFDSDKSMLADTPSKETFSQHANILAILTDAFDKSKSEQILNEILKDDSITKTSFYFSFYLFEAVEKLDFPQGINSLLEPWKNMIGKGLTTFAEKADPTRSDCHAWSASPLYYYLSSVCGIKPGNAAFSSVLIKPNLGELNFAEGQIPHRNGFIKTKYIKKGKVLSGSIVLPPGLNGKLIANGKTTNLNEGENAF